MITDWGDQGNMTTKSWMRSRNRKRTFVEELVRLRLSINLVNSAVPTMVM